MKRLNILIALLILLTIGGFLYLNVLPGIFPFTATLSVQSGEATILQENDASRAVKAKQTAALWPQNRLELRGEGSLALAHTTLDLLSGTRLNLVQHDRYPLGGWQIELGFQAGQIVGRIDGSGEAVHLKLDIRPGVVFAPEPGGCEFVARLDGDDINTSTLQVGMISGKATLSGAGKSVLMAAGQGTSVAPAGAPAEPAAWSRLRVSPYGVDGRLLALPVSLTANSSSGTQYRFHSDWPYIVPAGKYTLQIDLLDPYVIDDLELASGASNELPVTLSALSFTLADGSGAPIKAAQFIVQGQNTMNAAHLATGQEVATSPGTWTLLVWRAEALNASQQLQVSVSPGQRAVVPLRADLFGGAALKVSIIAPNGSPADPVDVKVFLPGNEDREPTLTFRSDSTPPTLPQGDYVVSVQTRIAARFEVKIAEGQQDQPIVVRLGTLQVNYTDVKGQPASRLMLVAVSEQMRRLNLPISQMHSTRLGSPYVYGIKTDQVLTLPSGVYTVLVDDVKPVTQENVIVRPGDTTTLNLKATP